ncbi:TonB-dependent receptor [Mucilaginibacter sp. HMF5004]|uniref:TonB-dependent receptor n=1 Tax=Mucilaginibacter rivuli TaxID=2857527 RepID=UPI001C5FD9EA|nr:TonB-dependent receptor [Mucilaginibacter rivuli]MBW4888216.1 TonB-dependent receptor [Mucilaginibacter rivuli]
MQYNYFLYRLLLLFLLGSVIPLSSFAQGIIRGKVIDAATKEPMVGATVQLKGIGKSRFVQLDGYYTIKDVKPGSYVLEFSFVSYVTKQLNITVAGGKVTVMNAEMVSNTHELSSVNITDNDNSNDKRARTLEKSANQLVNIVSARNIELSPDVTVANVMQRVSGVTIERSNSGEGRYPIIRGMEKRYINTLINGIKIPSPDNKNRFIPLDLFPSELLERLEVNKTLLPSMEGDAIGGTINLVMKEAPAKPLFQVNFAMGYNTVLNGRDFLEFDRSAINKQSPSEAKGSSYHATASDFPVNNLIFTPVKNPINTNLGITFGDRIGASKKLGYILSASYQNNYTGNNSTFYLPNASPAINNTPQFIELQNRSYSQQSRRLGLNAKLDYKFNKDNKISLVNVLVRTDDYQSRIISDTIALNSLVDAQSRSRWQYQSIYNATLQGVHQLDDHLKADWSLAYSQANSHTPDQADFTHEYPIVPNPNIPDIVQGMTRIWTHNGDQDYSAYANLTESFNLLKRKFEIKAGGVIRKKTRDNYYNSYSLSPVLGATTSQVYTGIANAQYGFKGADASLFAPDGNDYTFNETIAAGYLQGKWQLTDKLEAIGGVRVENTDQTYNSQLSASSYGRDGKITYRDFLPSGLLKYNLTANQSLRLSYYRALARPGFAEMIPDGQQGDYFKELGNPSGLNHTTADNIDLRYELFPKDADELLIGVFYKKIQDPIEYSAVKTGYVLNEQLGTTVQSGATTLTLIPQNFGTATNYGFEAVYTKYFGPIGIIANYTYTKSSITTPKLYSYSAPGVGTTSRFQDETRPLQGQSDHVGNIALVYKNPKMGLDAQVAFVYTGSRISIVSPYYGLDYWQEPTKQLDFSIEKKFMKKFSVYGKINNITNSPFILDIRQSYTAYAAAGNRKLALQTDPDNKFIVQKDYFKPNYLFGIRYKL